MNLVNRQVRVHYHSSFMYDVGLRIKNSNQGILAVVISVIAIESILGDLLLTYSTRRNASVSTAPLKGFRSVFRDFRQSKVFNNFPNLSAKELEILQVLESQGRNSALLTFFLLEGCIANEKRNPKDFKGDRRSELLNGDVVALFDIRNSISHRHGEELVYSTDSNGVISYCGGYPKSLLPLFENGVVKLDNDHSSLGWLHLLENSSVVEWSLATAKSFVNSFLNTLPDDSASNYFRSACIF
jgi:hypothetical protein